MRMKRGQAAHKRFEKASKPPPDPLVLAHPRNDRFAGMAALTAPARRIVDRILIEHMHHAGTENDMSPQNRSRFG
jgi:hypothetical protein